MLERTDRIWASDVIDPLERQQIQRWTAQLLPLELIGSHVGAPQADTTGRTHDLSFRAGTALFASFGIEWDLTTASEAERKELGAWVALYKEVRELLHTGTAVRAPQHDPAFDVHGVVAADRSEALYALVQLTAPETSVPGVVRCRASTPRAPTGWRAGARRPARHARVAPARVAHGRRGPAGRRARTPGPAGPRPPSRAAPAGPGPATTTRRDR